jgi:hypothetical protein
MTKDAPAGTLGLATLSGWMTFKLFIQVMKHFIHHMNSSKECPYLLRLARFHKKLAQEAQYQKLGMCMHM